MSHFVLMIIFKLVGLAEGRYGSFPYVRITRPGADMMEPWICPKP